MQTLSLGDELGRGESARVLSSKTPSGTAVAIKIAHSGFERNLLEEARSLAILGAATVPRLRGVGLIGSELALVQEEVKGCSLTQLLATGPSIERRLALAQKLLGQATDCLRQVHRMGWAHGDIKPDNVIVDEAANDRMRLIDWGMAHDSGTVRGGTPRYLPPQVLRGDSISPAHSDVYALAVCLCDILMNEANDEPPTLEQVRSLPSPFNILLEPILRPREVEPASLKWLASEAETHGAASRADDSGIDTLRAEYIGTRLHDLQGTALTRIEELDGWPRFWSEELLLAFSSIRDVEGSGEEILGPLSLEPVSDMSAHDKRRFLARLVGADATTWRLPRVGDAALIEALLRVGKPTGFRGLLFAELLAEVSGQTSSTMTPLAGGEETEAQLVDWALCLGRRPVPRDVLVAIGDSSKAPASLRLEGGRVARLRGDYALARHLLEPLSQAEAVVEKALTLSRQGLKKESSQLLEPVAAAEGFGLPQTHARALQARARLDAGDAVGALEKLAEEPCSAPVGEVRALCYLALSKFAQAGEVLDAAEATAETDEALARLWGVRGMLEHAQGISLSARERFHAAMSLARQSGAALEEATYATGLAAAASDAGQLAEALLASERAESLFEALEKESQISRALLARASVLCALGVRAEVLSIARRGVPLARNALDVRCEAFLLLCVADVLPRGAEKLQVSRRAQALLADSGLEDQLRAATRVLSAGGEQHEHGDDWAAEAEQLEVQVEWWHARARQLEALGVGGNSERHGMASTIVAELERLSTGSPAIAALGPALVAGAHLALRLGLAEHGRNLLGRARELASHFLENVPQEYRTSALGLTWLEQARGKKLGEESGPAQLSDVEGLLRALSGRKKFGALLDQVLDMLLLWTGVERGLILLRAPGEKMVVRAARNLAKKDLDPQQRALSQSMAKRALEEGRPVVAVDAMHDISDVNRSVHALHLRSVLAVPLAARGEVLGVVYLDDKVRRAAFGESELSWVSLISTVAALAIFDHRDHLALKRALGRARRAEARLEQRLSSREAELEVAERELSRFRGPQALLGNYDGIVGQGLEMTRLLTTVDRVAKSDVPALICGESGSGKELIARAIAQNSERRGKAFIVENCAAVPEGLLESALFGHQKGAFTGASRNQAGLFALAHQGTLFLDEIGEMSLLMQTKLLRVLQEGEIRPLGADSSRRVDVRLIVATHRDLKSMVEEGTFREDLFYRLNVVSLVVPPLRRRVEDIPALTNHFIQRYGKGRSVRLSEAAMARLTSYSWPGNVRQLENEVRRMLVLGGDQLTTADLSPDIMSGSSDVPQARTLKEKVDALERQLVVEALETSKGNRTRAAEELGLSRFGLQKMTQRLKIEVAKTVLKSGRNRDRGLDDS